MKQQHKAILIFFIAVIIVSGVGLWVAYLGLQDRQPPVPPQLPPPMGNSIEESTSTPELPIEIEAEQEDWPDSEEELLE